jgi:hypothetical protein
LADLERRPPRRAQSHEFWELALLTSLVEPLDQNMFGFQAGATG